MNFFDNFDGDDLKDAINKQLIDRFCTLSETEQQENVFDELHKKNMLVPAVYLDKVLTKAHREWENKEIKKRLFSIIPSVNRRIKREFFEVCQTRKENLTSKNKFYFLRKSFRIWVRENALNVLNKDTITQIIDTVQGEKEPVFGLLMQYNDEWPYGFLAGKSQPQDVSRELISTSWERTEEDLLAAEATEQLNQICWVHFTIWFKSKLNWGLRNRDYAVRDEADVDSQAISNRLTDEAADEPLEEDSLRLIPLFGVFLLREEQYTCINKRYRFDDPDNDEMRTYQEVADALCITVRDVTTHLFRGHERLRTMVKNAYRGSVAVPTDKEAYKTLMDICNIEAKNADDEKHWIAPCMRILGQDERTVLEKLIANEPQREQLDQNETKVFESATSKLSSMILGRRAYPYLSI
ncbi:RNA polymerase sigma factor [Cyclobacterium plantarum]|uniref:Uncharacterized protein n=1 Tax=Cyclobacterium plantarum TaxID=2716263 RepID=A0ABX0HEL7_9BACT|nr:hypothetical protein [Cyclobacterium plantarum]NHE58967.1 hypothetical protein [Cyclobacterium plantarum]